MAWVSLGAIDVPGTGTPVRVTSTPTKAAMIIVQADPGNTGTTAYVGLSGLTIAGLVDVLAVLTKGDPPFVLAQPTLGPNPFELSDLFIDVDTNGDNVLISYFEY